TLYHFRVLSAVAGGGQSQSSDFTFITPCPDSAPEAITLGPPTATFAVNDTSDTPDLSPGDGVCLNANGLCSLRAAVMEANALPGNHTISVPTGTYRLTIAGADEDGAAAGDLDITNDLRIQGAGSASTIIDGGALD